MHLTIDYLLVFLAWTTFEGECKTTTPIPNPAKLDWGPMEAKCSNKYYFHKEVYVPDSKNGVCEVLLKCPDPDDCLLIGEFAYYCNKKGKEIRNIKGQLEMVHSDCGEMKGAECRISPHDLFSHDPELSKGCDGKHSLWILANCVGKEKAKIPLRTIKECNVTASADHGSDEGDLY